MTARLLKSSSDVKRCVFEQLSVIEVVQIFRTCKTLAGDVERFLGGVARLAFAGHYGEHERARENNDGTLRLSFEADRNLAMVLIRKHCRSLRELILDDDKMGRADNMGPREVVCWDNAANWLAQVVTHNARSLRLVNGHDLRAKIIEHAAVIQALAACTQLERLEVRVAASITPLVDTLCSSTTLRTLQLRTNLLTEAKAEVAFCKWLASSMSFALLFCRPVSLFVFLFL